ncbi:MAG: hypothetical protein VYB35_01120 [Verrucomicrobiota bacterium]|nr:hypothetical protein [Verrucomicrobiota bacterium]|tara:strand:+ start:432 stop:863 length:432 start_codon:yes stop_codon:yes gene_type:complete
MKSFKVILTSLAVCLAMFTADAAEKKEKAADKKSKAAKERTVKGTIMCAKCTLKKTDSCQAALQVKRKGKDGKEVARVILLKNNDITKAFHSKICGSGDKVAVGVTGKLEGKGKNRVLVASKINDKPAPKGKTKVTGKKKKNS